MNSNFKAYIQCCDVCDRETLIAESFKSDVRLCFDCAKEAAATANPDGFKNTDSWKIEKEFPTIKDANAEYDRVLAKVNYLKREYQTLVSGVTRAEQVSGLKDLQAKLAETRQEVTKELQRKDFYEQRAMDLRKEMQKLCKGNRRLVEVIRLLKKLIEKDLV